MTETPPALRPGQRVFPPELGDGVVVETPRDGYVRVFFGLGERQVPVTALRAAVSRTDRLLRGVAGPAEWLRQVRLSCEAHALPLLESAAALTAAKIDLLPHQVVLTWWQVETRSPTGVTTVRLLPVAVDEGGERLRPLERLGEGVLCLEPTKPSLGLSKRQQLLGEHLEPTLARELHHRGLIPEGGAIRRS